MKNEKLDFSTDDVVLLITGCIAPEKSQKFLVLTDEDERLMQYIESIKFYINESPFTKIVFCENSAYPYDASELVRLAISKKKVFEWLSFQGDIEKVKECGKGYGEGEIIQYALSNSECLKKAKSFAKVTGRLIIQNIHKVVANVKNGGNYFNRDIYLGHGIDTRFYLCSVDFYRNFLFDVHTKTSIQAGAKSALEELFYRELKKHRNHRTLKAYPEFKGKSGGNGRDYSKISKTTIRIYSFLCQIRVFNRVYVVVLAMKKFVRC